MGAGMLSVAGAQRSSGADGVPIHIDAARKVIAGVGGALVVLQQGLEQHH